MTKVLLVIPTMYVYKGQTDISFPTPPLGMGYIATHLKKNKHNTKIFDMVGRKEMLKKIVEDFNPDIIGIQCYTTSYPEFKRVVLELRTYYKGLIVVGGPHITATGENDLPIDYFVKGEGEEIMLKLADDWRPSKKVIIAEPLDMNKYELDRSLFEDKLYFNEKRTSIVATRGCPYNCAFCFEASTTPRFRNAESIANEMKSTGKTNFIFNDDTTILNKNVIHELAGLIENKNYTISLNGRCNLMDEDLCKDLDRMGTKTIYFGVESGNQRMLDLMNKSQTTEQIYNSMELIKKFNFKASIFMIANFPTQTKQEMIEDFKFAKKLIKDYKIIVDYNILYCFPGTGFYKRLGKNVTDWSVKQHDYEFPNVPLWEEKGKDTAEMVKLVKNFRKRINFAEVPFKKKPKVLVNYILRNAYKKTMRKINPEKVFNRR